MRRLSLTFAILAIFAFAGTTLGSVTTAPTKTTASVYSSLVVPLPGNIASWGFEATQTNEFGNAVTFAGTNRNLSNVVVTMSSWACEFGHWYSGDCVSLAGHTFSQAITLNIYDAATQTPSSPGDLIGTVTQNFNIPYRPSASPKCKGGNAGEWTGGNGCFNGLAWNIAFDFGALSLPDDVIFGIAYNTTHYGYVPIGTGAACYGSSGGCPYDSLNVGLSTKTTVGTAGPIWQNTSSGWSNPTNLGHYIPAVQFNAPS